MGLSIYVPLSVSTKSDYRDPGDLLNDVKKFIEVKKYIEKNNKNCYFLNYLQYKTHIFKKIIIIMIIIFFFSF